MSRQNAAGRSRLFLVKTCDDGNRCRNLRAGGFEDAVLRCLEHWPPADDEVAVSLIVEDQESGERHCFTVEIGDGVVRPCQD